MSCRRGPSRRPSSNPLLRFPDFPMNSVCGGGGPNPWQVRVTAIPRVLVARFDRQIDIMGSCCCGSKTQRPQLKRNINSFQQRIANDDKEIQKLDTRIAALKRKLMLNPDQQTKKTLLEKLAQDILIKKKYNQSRTFLRKQLMNQANNRLTIRNVYTIQEANEANSGVDAALKVAKVEQFRFEQLQQKVADLRQIVDDIQGMNQQGQEYDKQLKALQAEFADPK